jgi:hypothetical protein
VTISFKYKEELDKLDCECPPLTKYKTVIRDCFRWVYEDINHTNNFLPVKIINSNRTSPDCEGYCSLYTLSFFKTLANAEDRYRSLAGKYAKFPERYGNSIAQGRLFERDGLANDPSENGHFELHEFENVSFNGRFTIIKKIKL